MASMEGMAYDQRFPLTDPGYVNGCINARRGRGRPAGEILLDSAVISEVPLRQDVSERPDVSLTTWQVRYHS